MRLFIAIELKDRVKDELCMIQKRIKLQGMKGNFTARENMHLTLAFIGEHSDPEQVSDALNDVVFEPVNISLDGFGCFKDLYWIGIKEDKSSYYKPSSCSKSAAEIVPSSCTEVLASFSLVISVSRAFCLSYITYDSIVV